VFATSCAPASLKCSPSTCTSTGSAHSNPTRRVDVDQVDPVRVREVLERGVSVSIEALIAVLEFGGTVIRKTLIFLAWALTMIALRLAMIVRRCSHALCRSCRRGERARPVVGEDIAIQPRQHSGGSVAGNPGVVGQGEVCVLAVEPTGHAGPGLCIRKSASRPAPRTSRPRGCLWLAGLSRSGSGGSGGRSRRWSRSSVAWQ